MYKGSAQPGRAESIVKSSQCGNIAGPAFGSGKHVFVKLTSPGPLKSICPFAVKVAVKKVLSYIGKPNGKAIATESSSVCEPAISVVPGTIVAFDVCVIV